MHDSVRRITSIVIAAVLLLALAAACSSDGAEPEDSRGIVETGESSEDETLNQDEVFEGLQGTTVNPDDLEAGQCFNEYDYYDRSQTRQQITTTVACDLGHDKELYAVVEHPAADDALFPGQDELLKFARRECLDSFQDFVGEEYVLSALEIGIFQPNYERWIADSADRTIGCYVYSPGNRLQGSMNGIGL